MADLDPIIKAIQGALERAPKWPKRRLLLKEVPPSAADLEEVERLATTAWWSTVADLVGGHLRVVGLAGQLPARADYDGAEQWLRAALVALQMKRDRESGRTV